MEVKVHKIALSIFTLIFVVAPLFTQNVVGESRDPSVATLPQDDVVAARHSESAAIQYDAPRYSESTPRHSEAEGEESRVPTDPSVATLPQDDVVAPRYSESTIRHSEGSIATEESGVTSRHSLTATPRHSEAEGEESRVPQDDKKDSLIRLLSATSAQLYQENNEDYRRVVGSPAVFLHNNTYLYCDTAVLNVSTNVLNSWGKVKIIQEETQLTGDRLIYLVDSSLAQFRGNIVRLENKEGNVLLTRHLDYNTKDSVAIFFQGASMRDKDGQIIESIDGRYESIPKKFTFNKRVNMFSDTTFVKCDSLEYFSGANIAYFYKNVNAWHNDYMLSAARGVYERDIEKFTFDGNVHLMDNTREGWCDVLKVYRETNDFEMFDHAQLNDAPHSTSAIAGHIFYVDTLKKVTLRQLPAIISVIDNTDESKHAVSQDSIFISANEMWYYSEIMCEMADSTFRQTVLERKNELTVDPVGEHRKKAAEAARQALEEAMENDPNIKAKRDAEKRHSEAESPRHSESDPRHSDAESEGRSEESRDIPDSSVAPLPQNDDTATQNDGTSPRADNDAPRHSDAKSEGRNEESRDTIPAPQPKDSTRVDFMVALGDVKVYKIDVQICCDSLLYNNFDSLARLFVDPVIWKDKTQQFNADSISMIIENGAFDRIFMMSNSFVQIRDADTLFFNQIRSAEMIAYFDTTSNLARYDALGDATALFYLEENGVIATANRKEAKMLSSEFVDGEINKVFYYDTPKSNAFSVASMNSDDKFLKGFSWRESQRPKSRYDVTTYGVRSSERTSYSAITQPEFKFTNIFFPGYIKKIRDEIQYRKDHPEARQKKKKESEKKPGLETDTLVSVVAADTTQSVKPVEADSRQESPVVQDTLASKVDSTAQVVEALTKKELRAKEREAKKKALQEKKEARWKAKDEKEQKRREARQAKKKEKLRRNKLKALKDQQEKIAAENKLRQKYLERLRAKAQKKQPLQQSVSSEREVRKSVPGRSEDIPDRIQ